MGVGFWLTIVSLLFVIIMIEGIIILRRGKPHEKSDEKPDEANISIHELKNQPPAQYVSSEKIKQLKEKEEQVQKIRAESTKKSVQHNKIKEENPKDTPMIQQEAIRAGEVQRGEKEQFNLRKDEESTIEPGDNGKWWI